MTSRDRKIEMPEFTLVSPSRGATCTVFLPGVLPAVRLQIDGPPASADKLRGVPGGTGPVDFGAPGTLPSVNSVGEPVSNAVGTQLVDCPRYAQQAWT